VAFIKFPAGEVSGSSPSQFDRIEIDALDFDKAAVALNELANYIEQVGPPLEAAKKIAIRDMKMRFQTETDPDGTKWFELDPVYAKRKEHEAPGHNILSWGLGDRDLEGEATEEARFSISGESIFYNTDNLPPYWRVHQQGSEGFGVVTHKWIHPSTGEEVAVHSRESSHGQNIPPRPYIGIGEEAELEIIDSFDLWFSKGIEEAGRGFKFSSSGTIFATVQGRFAGKAVIG
jgi:phage gpG-like protein